MRRQKFFYSTVSAAKAIGVSVRTIGRLAEDHCIEPLRISATGVRRRHFWTPTHLDEFRKYLKSA